MASSWTLIEDTVLSGAAASITFNTGLTSYTKFRLTLYVIKDGSAGVLYLRLNGDTGSNYTYQNIDAWGSFPYAIGVARTTTTFSELTATTIAASSTGLITLEMSKPLVTLPARTVSQSSFVAAAGIVFNVHSSEWNNTADAISTILIYLSAGDFATDTRAVLEGAA